MKQSLVIYQFDDNGNLLILQTAEIWTFSNWLRRPGHAAYRTIVYTYDNLLNPDTLTNTFDAASRLIETERAGTTLDLQRRRAAWATSAKLSIIK